MAFIKNVENFICEHCGLDVWGDGFTNHCPKCLWSKHVDKSPGDRGASCLGLMRPVRIEGTQGNYSVVHKCEWCGLEKRNKVSEKDDFDQVLKIISIN